MTEAEEITMTVLYTITMLVAILGNSLLIYIVWKKPEVRSLTSFMFVNMAVADLMVALVLMPWSITIVYTGSKWMITGVLGVVTCRAFVLISYSTAMASILCLTFMAIDRFCAVVYPLKIHNFWFRKAKFVTPLVWVMSIALMAIMAVVYKLTSNGYCDLVIWGTQTKTFRGIFLYIFVITYVIPLAVITPLYAKTAHKIWFSQAPGNPLDKNQQHQQEITKKRVVRIMLIIVVAVFALCWLPAQGIHLFRAIEAFYVRMPHIVSYLCFWLAHANSAINPWLYIRLSTKIRAAFIGMVTRKSNAKPRQSTQRTRSTKAMTKEVMQVSSL